jgi:hypothetical protein
VNLNQPWVHDMGLLAVLTIVVDNNRGAAKLDLVNWVARARILASARLIKVQWSENKDVDWWREG